MERTSWRDTLRQNRATVSYPRNPASNLSPISASQLRPFRLPAYHLVFLSQFACLEAITARLEAIATRVEAIATKVEAIATSCPFLVLFSLNKTFLYYISGQF